MNRPLDNSLAKNGNEWTMLNLDQGYAIRYPVKPLDYTEQEITELIDNARSELMTAIDFLQQFRIDRVNRDHEEKYENDQKDFFKDLT